LFTRNVPFVFSPEPVGQQKIDMGNLGFANICKELLTVRTQRFVKLRMPP
jgi:hypothetical protein